MTPAPRALASRAALASVAFGITRPHWTPTGGAVSLPFSRGLDRRAFLAAGYPVVGPRAVRADVLDRAVAHVRDRVDAPDAPDLPDAQTDQDDVRQLASWLGAPVRDVRKILAALTPPR